MLPDRKRRVNFLNPFIPHHPTVADMFVGRSKELSRLGAALVHTKKRKPINFMITGERGIGKTSLLNYVQSMAHDTAVDGTPLNFIVVNAQIESRTTQVDFVRKVELALRHELERTEVARAFFAKAWAFLQRVEVGGVSLKADKSGDLSMPVLWEDFANSLLAVANRTCVEDDPESIIQTRAYDGILLLIDEVDTASDKLDIGAFLKYLTEYFQRRGCRHILIGLSGLPGIVNVLLKSHPSALRVFDEIPLGMLSKSDVSALIDLYLMSARMDNEIEFTMTAAAKDRVIEIAEGHPHFIQQCSYCAFKAMERRVGDGIGPMPKVGEHTPIEPINITEEDVITGAFESRGAIDVIGDIYFRAATRPEIANPEVQAVLAYLSQYLSEGVSIADITVGSGIEAARAGEILTQLTSKGLVRHDEDRQTYRVCHRCFAYWLQKSGRGPQIMLGI